MKKHAQKRTKVSFAYWFMILAGGVCVQAQNYSVTDLGVFVDLPGKSESRPNEINIHGHVAGVNVTNGLYRALRYTGSWADLGTLGGSESFAGGINGFGMVAGYARRADGLVHAFLWTPGGTDGIPANPQMKDLGTLGGNYSEAYAVNDSGQMTGYSDVAGGTDSRAHAFLFADGKMTDIGKTVTGLPNSFGYAINRWGHVAGTAYDGGYVAPHAFLYDGNRGVDITVTGALGSTALALNDNDYVVGYFTTVDYFDHAFLYADGTASNLGTLGGHYSYALGINNSNAIVGGSFVDPADSIYHAFLYADGRMLDLNTALDTTGAGWVLHEASAINDSGQIVGTGSFQGATHGFLLTPGRISTSPRITNVSVSGDDLVLTFQSVAGATYSIQTRLTLTDGSWTNLVLGIQGNGGLVNVTHVGAATSAQGFYRVELSGD